MALSNAKIDEYSVRLLNTKNIVAIKYPFFSFLLSYIVFAVDEDCDTACTNGERIVFGTRFLETLNDDGLIFIMLHELMHCVLNHTKRNEDKNKMLYNVAADIVVNSILMETVGSELKIDGETPMHLTPDNEEGRLYSTEGVYQKLINDIKSKTNNTVPEPDSSISDNQDNIQNQSDVTGESDKIGNCKIIDDHSTWSSSNNTSDVAKPNVWAQRIIDAFDHSKACTPFGHIPEFAREYIKNLKSHDVDWKSALHNFCQRIDSFDYSWIRGDRRYVDRDMFLPDYSECDLNEMEVKDLLFFVDISGSMSNKEVNILLAEIRNAISVFNGKLTGKLGFFTTEVIEPVDFTDEASFNLIIPKSSGGTDFNCIFKYVSEKYTDNQPTAIIIMTDGYADYPDESIANGIPVTWVIDNKQIKPPWGETICFDSI